MDDMMESSHVTDDDTEPSSTHDLHAAMSLVLVKGVPSDKIECSLSVGGGDMA